MRKVKSSQYVGVSKHRDQWRPWIKLSYGLKQLGMYDDEKTAALVRDAAVYRFAIETKAKLNFRPEDMTMEIEKLLDEALEREQGQRGADRKPRKSISSRLLS